MKTFMLSLFMMCTMSLYSAEGLKVGDNAIDFSLKNIDGSMISLSDYAKDNGVVVIFTCNHCPFSIAYEDRFFNLNNSFSYI